MTRPDPVPPHLAAAGVALWRAIIAEFVDIDPVETAILLAAAESADRVAESRAIIDAEGLSVVGRYGPRVHPLVSVERDARAAMVRSLASLGADRQAGEAAVGSGATSFPRGRGRSLRAAS